MAAHLSVSSPCVQCDFLFFSRVQVKLKESKFGRALVMKTTQRSGAYVLGFRIDPADKV